MLLASAADFEPVTLNQTDQPLYWPGYREYPFFASRLEALRGRFAPAGQKLAICGCGWGYLVEKCVAAGYDAYGLDFSSYAINKAQALFPALASRFLLTDCTNGASMNAARVAMGLPGNKKIDLAVTEDLLPCLSDAEITAALAAIRGQVSANLLHIVTLANPTSLSNDPRLNWKTGPEWLAICSPPDLVLDHTLTPL